LAEHRETLLLSKRLVVLETKVPIEANSEQLKTRTVDAEGVLKVLSELEFHSFAKEFAEKFHTDKIIRKTEISSAEIKKYAGIHIDGDNVFLSFNENEVYITSMKHAFSIISKPDITKIGYDLKQAIKTGALKSPLFDLKIGAWLIDPNMKNNEFEDICLKYLNCYCEPTPEAISNLSLKLYPVLSKKLEELGEIDLYTKIEEPLIFVLAEMEKRGIGIDIGYLKELRKQIEKDITALADECYRIAGSVFNINSPKQLSHILFEKLKLTPLKKGKSHYSTDFEVLQQLSAKHELPRKILEYRELAKVSSTYIDPLIEFARNSRIHTTFNQTGTATGRLSSNNPNIQNIPIRSHLGNELRKGFVAQKGFLLISADYSQIELRILAHISKDTNLIEAFKTSRDIHNHTASLIFDTGEDNVDEQKRRIAKVVNYGLIYGMSDYGLAQELGISLEQAGQFIQSYYGLYPEVNRWRVSAISSVEQKGYTETLFGRKRPIPEINSDNHNLREFGKRLAINTPIQGTAADLIKLSMIEVEKRLSQAGFKSGLLLSIHDELLFEIEEERISEAGEIIKKAMENVCEFDVPIVVNINIGKNWAEAH
ncbi:MAG: DNA polymerase, partial [candidate division WOR-3 bacterium]